MILASTVYDTLQDAIRKDSRGRSLSVEEYNSLAVVVNRSLFDDFYSKFEGNIESSDTLGLFKVFEYGIDLTANANNTEAVGTLPANYYHIIGLPRTISGTPGTVSPVDVVTAQEHSIRINDYLTQPTVTYPMCQIGGVTGAGVMQIRAYPYVIAKIYIDYLREPNTPYLDFYVNDTTLNYTYMLTGATVTVPLGSTYRDETPGVTVQASQTINWEYDEEDLSLIIAKFMSIIGIQLESEILVQAGQLTEAKAQMK